MKLLVVEDEVLMCHTIAEGLRMDGYEVDTCNNGTDAWNRITEETYDLVILDLNLPGMDGMEVLREVRKHDENTLFLILSARGSLEDKIEGLDSGASDYLTKPFHFEELEARVRSLTRRYTVQKNVVLTCDSLTLDTKKRTAMVEGVVIPLTRKELGLLEYLLLNQGRPVSQEELIRHVWDSSVDEFSNSIRVHMSALRKKLRTALGYDPITNRIGIGYILGGKHV